MVCTNSKKIYELVKILRSHGMVRESGNKKFEKDMIKKYPNLSPKFIFLYPAYNFRNNEISATIGLNQLKSLNQNNKKRNNNLKIFLNNINKKFYRTNFDLKGCSNYAFPLILNKKNFKNRNLLESSMLKNRIEFRRGNAGGGNQLRQPYLSNIVKNVNLNNFKEVDHIHFFGYYIGNYPTLTKKKILKICKILNNIKYDKTI
jgi:CDP-6-deoxy-D-xylo-4-hexulose-3-dehydrase